MPSQDRNRKKVLYPFLRRAQRPEEPTTVTETVTVTNQVNIVSIDGFWACPNVNITLMTNGIVLPQNYLYIGPGASSRIASG